MSANRQQITAAGFIASVLLLAGALIVTLIDSGDSSGPITVIAGVSLVCFIGAMIALRGMVTAQSLGPLALVSLAAFVATIIATTTQSSGVVLAVPIAAMAMFVLARSKWRLGDTGIFVLVTGMGTGLGYILEAALDADTGSYGDQGALAVIGCRVVVSRCCSPL